MTDLVAVFIGIGLTYAAARWALKAIGLL